MFGQGRSAIALRKRQFDLGSLRLDEANECLWRGEERLALRPKTYALLHYLVEHAGRLVTKDELLDNIWAETSVGDAVLKVCVRELRGNPGRRPRARRASSRPFTAAGIVSWSSHASLPMRTTATHRPSRQRRGGQPRCLAAGASSPRCVRLWSTCAVESAAPSPSSPARPASASRRWSTRSSRPWTTPKCAWLRGSVWRGFGTAEPYHPFLESIARLARDPRNTAFVTCLRHRAPTWLVQLPWLIGEEDRERLGREILGATRERMLRELAEALEVWTAAVPTVLVFEDLHWGRSLHAGLDRLARAPARARAALGDRYVSAGRADPQRPSAA